MFNRQIQLLQSFKKFGLYNKYDLLTRNVPVMYFSSKFSESECSKILDVINKSKAEDFERFQLKSSRINKVIQHRAKYGKFDNLDKLLEVDGLTVRVANKLFKNIIEFDESKAKDDVKKEKPKIRGQLIHPALNDIILEDLTSAVGIYIGVNSVSWTKIQRNEYLVTDWNMYNFTNDGAKRTLVDNFEMVLQISKKIPYADIYVLEAVPKFSQSNQPMVTLAHMQYLQLCTMLITILNTSRIHNPDFIFYEENDLCEKQLNNTKTQVPMKHKVYFLRSNLPARIFQTLIGTERVSAENVVNNILQKSVSSTTSNVSFNETVRMKYESSLPIEKEILSQALLLSLAFMDIFMYH